MKKLIWLLLLLPIMSNAQNNNLKYYNLRRFPADWSKHGKAAGPLRNQEMADYATHLIAFPIGDSPGTRDMIRKAKAKGLVVKVIES